jgi:polyhydroxyalkanoate synthesis repressor PhaR
VVTQRSTAGPDPVVIRKYPNRRLYDTGAKRYVNLEEIAALIRQGREVQVVDSRTGEDLTRIVLTQIITEDAKGQPAGLPLELLRQLVMATDHARQELLGWYLRSAFDAYHKVQEAVQSRLEDVRSAALSPLGVVRNLFSGATPPAPAQPSELDYLRRRVAELEERLLQLRVAAAPMPKVKRARTGKKAKSPRS